MVADTCPHIDAALAAAADAIKKQTTVLREALVTAIERAIDAEDQVKALERDLAGLKSEVPLPEFEKGDRVSTSDGEGCIRISKTLSLRGITSTSAEVSATCT